MMPTRISLSSSSKLKSRIGEKTADTILDKTKRTFKNGKVSVILMEGWKTMIVSKLMYGCGALAWYKRECDDLEVIQNGFGR